MYKANVKNSYHLTYLMQEALRVVICTCTLELRHMHCHTKFAKLNSHLAESIALSFSVESR